jgi:hypothetical protein
VLTGEQRRPSGAFAKLPAGSGRIAEIHRPTFFRSPLVLIFNQVWSFTEGMWRQRRGGPMTETVDIRESYDRPIGSFFYPLLLKIVIYVTHVYQRATESSVATETGQQ